MYQMFVSYINIFFTHICVNYSGFTYVPEIYVSDLYTFFIKLSSVIPAVSKPTGYEETRVKCYNS
jgi:hypothetical protein